MSNFVFSLHFQVQFVVSSTVAGKSESAGDCHYRRNDRDAGSALSRRSSLATAQLDRRLLLPSSRIPVPSSKRIWLFTQHGRSPVSRHRIIRRLFGDLPQRADDGPAGYERLSSGMSSIWHERWRFLWGSCAVWMSNWFIDIVSVSKDKGKTDWLYYFRSIGH